MYRTSRMEISPTPSAICPAIDRRRPVKSMTPGYRVANPVLRRFALGDQPAVHRSHLNRLGHAENLQHLDQQPTRVELVPGQPVTRRSRVRVVLIVPAFAEADHRDPP